MLILRDVLGWTGAETAELLETTVTAVNSALQRARATIEAEAPARVVAPGRRTQRDLLARYVDAWERADISALVALLREDAVLTMPPEGAIFGAAAIAAFLAGRCGGRTAQTVWVNRMPAVELRDADGALHRLVVLTIDDERIAQLYAYAPSRNGA